MGDLLLMIGVFLASFVVGYALIRRVPPMLHTPLMSMTNGISAVTILGALLLFAPQHAHGSGMTTFEKFLGIAALAAATFNLAGGLLITDRMLAMFRQKQPSKQG